MAYNRSFNPDALPAFAEPERKHSESHSNIPPPQTYQSPPPQIYQQPPPQTYAGRPQPAPPNNYHSQGLRHDSRQQNNYSSQGHRQPSPGLMSPPLQQSHSPTPQTAGGRPIAVSRPPPSPSPSGKPTDPALLPLFKAVDKNRTGQLSEAELGSALVNGDWSPFDPHTVRMMIRMFDSDRSGTIGFEEFCGLWGFLGAWRQLFDRFDVDRSGNISLPEYTDALVAFGYRLSTGFVETLFRIYDKRNSGAIGFDVFVQSCISLKRMTDVFKRYDDDRDGFITLSFEDFLTEILRQK